MTMSVFRITKTKSRTDQKYTQEGTLAELIKAYQYTLDTGASWSHEKGNRKINTNPKTIKSLVTNLNNASNNAASNGYSGLSYDYEKVA